MKKFAFILVLSSILFACHTKEDQNKSGINDPINITYGDIDSTVLTLEKSGEAPVAKSAADTITTAVLEPCIDSTQIDTAAMCTQEYKPVCGCDEVTYSNECMAKKAGVTTFTEGECKK